MPHHHGGFDPQHLLEGEEDRRRRLPPEQLLPDFLTGPGEVLIDYGCGAGFFALPAARFLHEGQVWAVDRDPRMVALTLERARAVGLTNVRGLVADGQDLAPAAGADAALLANVFHDLEDSPAVLEQLRRALKPGGRLYLVEWEPVPTDMGPPLALRIAPGDLTARLEAAGFRVVAIHRGPSPFYRVLAEAA